jgi:hypothetical protein
MFYYKREVTLVSKWFAVNDLFLGLLKLSRSENITCGSILERIENIFFVISLSP